MTADAPPGWDPGLYMAFAGARTRPALDLMSRLDGDAGHIVDLGCGPGHVTALLARRWPAVAVTGVDSSADMLAAARRDYAAHDFPRLGWVQADIAAWRPEIPPDILFSNACLHWLPDHPALFARLLGMMAPGGRLAVQMPRNFDRPCHELAREAARQAGCMAELAAQLDRAEPVAEPAEYDRWLSPLCRDLDIWETDYLHVLPGDNPVALWGEGTWMRPLAAALGPEARRYFLDCWRGLIRRAYPPAPDGRTRFAFRRLFLIARLQG